MSEVKPPVDPGANPNDPNSIKPGWPKWLQWYVRRASWAPNQPLAPSSNPTTDALRGGGAAAGKAPVDAPEGFEAQFAQAKAMLMAIVAIGRGVGMSVLEAMGATSKTLGRLRRALQRGVSVGQIVDAFNAVNNAGAFTDAHYDGGDVWYALTYPHTVEALRSSNDEALVTGDAQEALDRLDIGIGYAGNELAPGAVEAARAAAAGSGYKYEDTFVLAEVGGARAGGGYDDLLKDLTPQEFLDREMQARGRGPSGGDR